MHVFANIKFREFMRLKYKFKILFNKPAAVPHLIENVTQLIFFDAVMFRKAYRSTFKSAIIKYCIIAKAF